MHDNSQQFIARGFKEFIRFTLNRHAPARFHDRAGAFLSRRCRSSRAGQ